MRNQATVIYNTALGKVFAVEKYAVELMKVVEKKGIQLNVRHNLIKVDPLKRKATFELLDENARPNGKTVDYNVS